MLHIFDFFSAAIGNEEPLKFSIIRWSLFHFQPFDICMEDRFLGNNFRDQL